MVLRIHDKSFNGKIQIATSWYLTTLADIDAYQTNAVFSNINDSTDILFWQIDVSSSTVDLYATAIRHYSDGSTEKEITGLVYSPTAIRSSYANRETRIELPILTLQSNTYVNGTGNAIFTSSTIRPASANLKTVHWYVRNSLTGEYLYEEETGYTFILDSTKIDMANTNRVDILALHKATNNVVSGVAMLTHEVNKHDITITGLNSVDPDNTFNFNFTSITATSLTLTDLKIVDSNGKTVYSSINSMPPGTLDYNRNYSVAATFNVITNGNSFVARKVFELSTSKIDQPYDIQYGTTAMIGYSTLQTGQYGISAVLRDARMVVSNPDTANTLPIIDFVTGATLQQSVVDQIVYPNSFIDIKRFNSQYFYVTSYDTVNSTMNVRKYDMSSIAAYKNPVTAISMTSQSSNVAIRRHREIYFINNDELRISDITGNTSKFVSLPPVSFSITSLQQYRVHLINDNELYVITNTNAILSINLVTKEIDILKSFTRTSSNIISAITSDGGLIIIDGSTASIIYNRSSDTITYTTEAVKGLIIESNNKILKVL